MKRIVTGAAHGVALWLDAAASHGGWIADASWIGLRMRTRK